MVKTKNAHVGQSQNPEEGGTSRGKGKGKRVPSRARVPEAGALDRFISVKEATRFEEWTRNRRKIAPGHRVDLNDMQGGQDGDDDDEEDDDEDQEGMNVEEEESGEETEAEIQRRETRQKKR
ncbi:hypothetical protein M9H77_19083 [Catharanthus roseus]|uniref:Uncharacterized protein n=1 Tax=Catharanthus roseus TaxID=4058 RepID=A0ACC0B991_CATRO|nr:hypothetical protein M9H77_19083 [Catharanthus roseus]